MGIKKASRPVDFHSVLCPFPLRSNEILNGGHDLRLPPLSGLDDGAIRRGSDSSVIFQHQPPANFFAASIDSVEDEDEEVDKRNGGAASGLGRRTSKLSDLFDKKRRPDKKRWKDKQGKARSMVNTRRIFLIYMYV